MTDRIGVTKASPSTSFWLEADVVGQDVAGNFSRVHLYLRAANGPSGTGSSQFNAYGAQLAVIDGIGEIGRHEGNPFLPSGYAQNQQRWRVGPFQADIGHDAAGNHPGITVRMQLRYGSISEDFTAYVGLPRIPKPPGAPNPVSIDQITETSFRYIFVGTTDGGGGISGWHVQYSTHPAFADGGVIIDSWGTSWPSELTPGVQYYVRSRGYNPYGYSPWSNAMTVRTLTPPAAPSPVSLAPGSMRVTWTPPASNLIVGVTGYDLQYANNDAFTNPVTLAVGGGASPYTVGNLTPGAQLRVRIRAKYPDTTGPWSQPSIVNVLGAVYASDGDEWEPAAAFTSNGSTLAAAQVLYNSGTDWLAAK